MPITSGSTGWGSPLASWENIAKTSNKGVEFTINSRNIVTKDFKWNTTLTGTWSKEKIESLPNGDLISENLFVGKPIHVIYDYKYAGIWGTDASQEELDKYGVKPGWVKVETIEKFDEMAMVTEVCISTARMTVRYWDMRILTGLLVLTILSSMRTST